MIGQTLAHYEIVSELGKGGPPFAKATADKSLAARIHCANFHLRPPGYGGRDGGRVGAVTGNDSRT